MTTSAKIAADLQKHLKAVGIVATEVGLHGRFHWDGHRQYLTLLEALCNKHNIFQFQDTPQQDVFSGQSAKDSTNKHHSLHAELLRSILVEPPQWFTVFSRIHQSKLQDPQSKVVCFGPERCVPPSILRKLRRQISFATNSSTIATKNPPPTADGREIKDDDIAVVGMSCKVAGAEDLESFWDLLCRAESQHQEVPKERFDFDSPFRKTDPKRKWFGNFLDDYDMFDHKFFKKSPREAASMDPQQRQLLQIAYQALEQAGYFLSEPKGSDVIGCYTGVCATDYENNVGCYEPTAFTATGNLRGFIAGKVSHYFGWTGPGLTIDTACSSSLVAVHQACKAILSGECTAALAAGTHIMTSPLWFQNLAGASFLSPTGPCKPFDAKADGYCRGEGVAAVYLKKASDAIADGNQIFGIIAASAVHQNHNCTPVFVPNTPSLSGLFKVVVEKAKIRPERISVAQVHGPGTVVGDVCEYESIRRVLGGPSLNRSRPLTLTSVKGLVGHTECTSGLISLITTLLMTVKRAIPPQASFQTISPAIKASPSDQMSIPTSLQPWNEDFRVALINNYGASGSNASVVIKEAPDTKKKMIHHVPKTSPNTASKQPFWIAATDDKNLRQYSTKLCQYLRRRHETHEDLSIQNLAFNLARQSNRSLGRGLVFSCSSADELELTLTNYANGTTALPAVTQLSSSPIILCFGGQVSDFVGLDRQMFESVSIFRKHIQDCDSACVYIGAGSIFPAIFERKSIGDPVKLQTCLFAMQYSCARSWIDVGVRPDAVIGHSFGELTALCISGVLTLEDAVRLVVGRARVIRESWGSETGAMMAVEAPQDEVERILATANQAIESSSPASIACYNGPKSFTLAGSQKAIDAVAEVVKENSQYASVRMKKLRVTHAFHSSLVDSLMSELEAAAQELSFGVPHIHLERATEQANDNSFDSSFVAEHMRNPVFFHHAAQRLAAKFPSSVWLEAGSNSTITNIAKKALGGPTGCHFQPVSITGDDPSNGLVDATISLWRTGLNVAFWSHHSAQISEFSPLLLPPYQFEKTRHWLSLKKPPVVSTVPQPQTKEEVAKPPDQLLRFLGYSDDKGRCARFEINTAISKYKDLISGHVIAETAPICPATVQISLAIDALQTLIPELDGPDFNPEINSVQYHAAVCIDSTRSLWIDLEASNGSRTDWIFKVKSAIQGRPSNELTHTIGHFKLHTDKLLSGVEFAKFERLRSHSHCLSILNGVDADDIVQGRNIYKMFSEIVDYGEDYRGVTKLVGKGQESAGTVIRSHNSESWLDPHMSDAFCQVGGMWVNCMTERKPSDMFIACGIEQWLRSPKLRKGQSRPPTWNVSASHHKISDKTFLTDVFVFDAANGALLEVILGIQYMKVTKASVRGFINKSTSPRQQPPALGLAAPSVNIRQTTATTISNPHGGNPTQAVTVQKTQQITVESPRQDVSLQVKAILAELAGLGPEEIQDDADLANLGIDSLMGMEMVREIEIKFKCTLPVDEISHVVDVPGLMRIVNSTVSKGGILFSEQVQSIDIVGQQAETYDQSSDVGSDATTMTISRVNVMQYLSEFLGVGEEELDSNAILRDLGVDSLLSMELRADLTQRFSVTIPEEVAVEELTVTALDQMMTGLIRTPPPTPPELSKPAPDERTNLVSTGAIAAPKVHHPLELDPSMVKEAFTETKRLTDTFIVDFHCDNYAEEVLPLKNDLCIALVLECLQQMKCSVSDATAGQQIPRIQHQPEHSQLVDYLYKMLEQEGQLITLSGHAITRTETAAPSKSSAVILNEIVRRFPAHEQAAKLTHYAGTKLPQVLTGETDGVKLIFGAEEGRQLVSSLYGDWPLNRLFYKQMEVFLSTLASKLPAPGGVLKCLEAGAGTGGTSKWLIPLLASLKIPVEYTFTDISPAFLAAARKKFKAYDFLQFRTHDIEKPPADDLIGTQHIVVASNAIHATSSLTQSASNMRKFLRPDGLLMMLEMTGTLYWCDIIFGLFEGWWLFSDGRKHAVSNENQWKAALLSSGYGYVDWTDGARPENKLEKVIIALASDPRYDHPSISPPITPIPSTDYEARLAVVETYVKRFTSGFKAPSPVSKSMVLDKPSGHCVLITGATGSVGSHLVAALARLDSVNTIICLNRQSGGDPKLRQAHAIISKGLFITSEGLAKIRAFECEMAKPKLGLPDEVYENLLSSVTHIIHNAWLMSAKRAIKGFESQFSIMQNMINLASDCASKRPAESNSKLSFLFVSSIAVVGYYPLWKNDPKVPEERMPIEAVLPNGYGDAKYTCELMLDATLHRYPQFIRTTSVRIGQIAGSKKSGYWNPMEHLSYLWKSSQSLRCLPDFRGLLSWTPVDDVAGTLADLVLSEVDPFPIVHIDNPVRQNWADMIPVIASALDIPLSQAIPFEEWIHRVRNAPSSVPEADNPAIKLVDFLDHNFLRMSCGGLLLQTDKAKQHSKTLRAVQPVTEEVARKFFQAWKDMRFLA